MKTTIPAESDLASGDYLAVVRDFALSKGISLQVLLADSQISLEALLNPPNYVKNLIVNRVGVNLYEQLNSPVSAAAEFGVCMTASTHGSLGMAVQCAANVYEAFEILRTFYNTRINSQNIQIETRHTSMENDYVFLRLINKHTQAQGVSHVQDFFDLATLVSIATNTYRALDHHALTGACLLYTSPSPRDRTRSRMPSSA